MYRPESRKAEIYPAGVAMCFRIYMDAYGSGKMLRRERDDDRYSIVGFTRLLMFMLDESSKV